MTDFVDDLEAELLKAARRRSRRRRRLALRIPVRPALVLAAAALAAFLVSARGGAPEPEREVTKPPVSGVLPVAKAPASCGRVPTAQAMPDSELASLTLFARPRTAVDAIDGSRLPIATYDPDRTRRVGGLGVVLTGAVLDCSTGTNRGLGACLVYRAEAAHCFTLAEIRAGKAFALVEEERGSRLIGLVADGPTRVILSHRGAVAAVAVEENTVDDLFVGLKPTDKVTLELDRQTAQLLVLNQTGTKGRAAIEAARLRTGLNVDVAAEESDRTLERTVVSSTSTKSNGLARKTAQLLEGAEVELAPEGSDLKLTTPGVIVALGKDRMR